MSESRWTKGPWFIEDTFADGDSSFTVRSDHWLVAIRVDYDANARLISASPDLADVVETRPVLPDIAPFFNSEIALKVTAEFPDIVAFLGNFAAWDDRARAALSRAKGETT